MTALFAHPHPTLERVSWQAGTLLCKGAIGDAATQARRT